jgi:hypothetical protein
MSQTGTSTTSQKGGLEQVLIGLAEPSSGAGTAAPAVVELSEEEKAAIKSRLTEGGKNIRWRSVVLPKVKEVLKQFKANGVSHPTIRATYYRLYSMRVIPENSKKMYKGLLTMLIKVRMEGSDPDIQPDTFSDESRESPYEYDIETLEQWVDDQVSEVQSIIDGEVDFDVHKWMDQPKYVEVWIEKQAMYSTFRSILSGWEVVIQPSHGFNSLSTLFEAYERLKRVQNNCPNREIVILYFGDLDPSGDSMDDDLQGRLDHFSDIWGDLEYKFERVAVKPEHVQEYNLPEDPDEATASRLRNNDPRYRSFMRKYGKLYAVELDALAGQEPEAFRKLVLDSVSKHFDEDIWERVQEENSDEKAKELLAERLREELNL